MFFLAIYTFLLRYRYRSIMCCYKPCRHPLVLFNPKKSNLKKPKLKKYFILLIMLSFIPLETLLADKLNRKATETALYLYSKKEDREPQPSGNRNKQGWQSVPESRASLANSNTARLLLERYVRQDSDPDYIEDDLITVAEYLSQHSEALAIIDSLQEKKWSLVYKKNTFQADIKGKPLQVDSVKIYFDPRSAAKFKFHRACKYKKRFCITSPADALLHEFLHAQGALINTSSFITEGGFSGVIYPFHHERKIIKRENALYKKMTQTDGIDRPIRSDHHGRSLSVSCVTCIE